MSNPLEYRKILYEHAFAFTRSKLLATVVELNLFNTLSDNKMTGKELEKKLGFHPRATWDFLDTLVAMKILERDGNGLEAVYYNSPLSRACLCKDQEYDMSSVFTFIDTRLYKFWSYLAEAVKTGTAQNELVGASSSDLLFTVLCAEAEKVALTADVMANFAKISGEQLLEKFDFSSFKSLCQVGGGNGDLLIAAAKKWPHLQLTLFETPYYENAVKENFKAANLNDKIQFYPGTLFETPLPKADVIIMSLTLHHLDMTKKLNLIQQAYKALPDNGALIVIEYLIDDDRRANLAGLLMSLNMLIEFGTAAFEYTFSDYTQWCSAIGFQRFALVPLSDEADNSSISAAIAYKS